MNERERDRRERDTCFVFVHVCACSHVRSSVTLSEAIIDYTVLSLAEVDQRLACRGI